VIVNIGAYRVPDARDQLPFVDQARPITLEEQRRVERRGGSSRVFAIEADGAAGCSEGRLRLAAGSRSLDEHGTGGQEPRLELVIGESRPVVRDLARETPLEGTHL
jgi:hypothetical protein